MHKRTISDYPKRVGIINGFSSMPTEVAEFVRSDLGLSMPISAISRLQNHYRIIEHREPTVDELLMLDILFANNCAKIHEGQGFDLAELTTDDAQIKETFDDLICKLNTIYPTRKGPIPFEDILTAAEKYLNGAMPERHLLLEELTNANKENGVLSSVIGGAYFAKEYNIGKLKFTISKGRKSTQHIKSGVFIEVAKNDNLPGLINRLRSIPKLKFKASIIENNVIEAIALSTLGGTIYFYDSMAAMATFGRGDLLICCDQKHEMQVCQTIAESGMRFRKAGLKTNGGKIKFESPYFVTELQGGLIADFAIPKRRDMIYAHISESVNSNEPECIFEEVSATDSAECELSISSVKSNFKASPYLNGIVQTICAMGAAIVSSDQQEKAKLSHIVRFNAKDEPSVLLSHLLGLYRGAIELCAPLHNSSLHISANISECESKTVVISKKQRGVGINQGNLWLVYPDMPKGAIDFANIRNTFAYINEFKNSKAKSRISALDCGGMGNADVDVIEKTKNIGFGAFLVLTDALLVPAKGVLCEQIGIVTPHSEGEKSENI